MCLSRGVLGSLLPRCCDSDEVRSAPSCTYAGTIGPAGLRGVGSVFLSGEGLGVVRSAPSRSYAGISGPAGSVGSKSPVGSRRVAYRTSRRTRHPIDSHAGRQDISFGAASHMRRRRATRARSRVRTTDRETYVEAARSCPVVGRLAGSAYLPRPGCAASVMRVCRAARVGESATGYVAAPVSALTPSGRAANPWRKSSRDSSSVG